MARSTRLAACTTHQQSPGPEIADPRQQHHAQQCLTAKAAGVYHTLMVLVLECLQVQCVAQLRGSHEVECTVGMATLQATAAGILSGQIACC